MSIWLTACECNLHVYVGYMYFYKLDGVWCICSASVGVVVVFHMLCVLYLLFIRLRSHPYIYICVKRHTYVHLCIYIHIYIYTHIHIYTCIYIYIYTFKCCDFVFCRLYRYLSWVSCTFTRLRHLYDAHVMLILGIFSHVVYSTPCFVSLCCMLCFAWCVLWVVVCSLCLYLGLVSAFSIEQR